jgi:hypothetical protein
LSVAFHTNSLRWKAGNFFARIDAQQGIHFWRAGISEPASRAVPGPEKKWTRESERSSAEKRRPLEFIVGSSIVGNQTSLRSKNQSSIIVPARSDSRPYPVEGGKPMNRLPLLHGNGFAVSRDLNPKLVSVDALKPLGRQTRKHPHTQIRVR